jgi:cysteine desulfurase
VLRTVQTLESQGFTATYLPVDEYGCIDPDDLEKAIRPDTIAISIMHANSEVGTIQPIEAIGCIARERGIPLHVDAVQTYGKIPVDVERLGIDLLSCSAHKIYGPKGVGALYIRKGTRMVAVQHGGDHERRRRAGTENVAGIVGFARALELIQADAAARDAEASRQAQLRDGLVEGLRQVPGVTLTGHPLERLPNNASFVIDGIEGGDLVAALDLEGIEASTGSACTTGSVDPSHVLLAMGLDEALAHGSLRLTVGRSTTADDVQRAVDVAARAIDRLRGVRAEVPATVSA